VTTRYYEKHLAELHQRLLGHAVVQTYLTGTGIRFDGAGACPEFCVRGIA
jgi:hypothetical protein